MIFNIFILPFAIISMLMIIFNSKKYAFYLAIAGVLLSGIFLALLSKNYFLNFNNLPLNHIINFGNGLYSLSSAFIIIFIFNTIFVLSQKNINFKELGFLFLYFSASIGFIFATDFIHLTIYFELLSLLGACVILLSNNVLAKKVAIKYFVIHLFGGSIFLIGVIEYVIGTGSIFLPSEPLDLSYRFNYFLLMGLLINVGIPPLSSWLVDGYSKCSHNASIYLSVFTTKASIFMILVLFNNNIALTYVGVILSLYGLIFSSFETNFRRILAFSIIQQLGIMLIIFGFIDFSFSQFIVSYIVVNIFYKSLLFMLAKILSVHFGTNNIKNLQGVINIKSFLGFVLIFSSIQVLGLPISGGFIVKTYMLEQIHNKAILWFLFFLASSSALNIGIRLPWTLLSFKNSSSKILFENKLKFFSFAGIIIILQSIYFVNIQFVNLSTILHSLEILLFSIVLFVIINKIILKNKEEILQRLVKSTLDVAYTGFIFMLYKLVHINIFNIFKISYRKVIKLFTNLQQNNQSFIYSLGFAQKLVLFSLVCLIFIYWFIRLF